MEPNYHRCGRGCRGHPPGCRFRLVDLVSCLSSKRIEECDGFRSALGRTWTLVLAMEQAKRADRLSAMKGLRARAAARPAGRHQGHHRYLRFSHGERHDPRCRQATPSEDCLPGVALARSRRGDPRQDGHGGTGLSIARARPPIPTTPHARRAALPADRPPPLRPSWRP